MELVQSRQTIMQDWKGLKQHGKSPIARVPLIGPDLLHVHSPAPSLTLTFDSTDEITAHEKERSDRMSENLQTQGPL